MSRSRSIGQYIVLVISLCILSGQTRAVINNNSTETDPVNQNSAKKLQSVRGTSQQVFSSNDETDQISFQYEPSAFLLGKSSTSTTSTSTTTNKPQTTVATNNKNHDDQQDDKLRNYLLPPPATTMATSGRSGRMLDLDALMGEKSARSMKERSQSGVRQSRYLHQQQQTMDVGNKKLKIQGFIPIVSIKDDTNGDDDEQQNEHQQNNNNNNNNNKHQQRLLQQQSSSSHDTTLPYGQSSIGHASFGIQRYVQNEPPQFVNSNMETNNQQQSPSMKASVVDTLKRPLKRLASLTSSSQQEKDYPTVKMIQGQDCLCVPFYMCKNGFVSESSVSKAQLQQMFAQQMQQNQRSPASQQSQLQQGSFSIATSPEDSIQAPVVKPADQTNQAQYADSIVPVDERSMERDLISTLNFSNALNQQDDTTSSNRTALSASTKADSNSDGEQVYSSIQQLTSSANNADNSTSQIQSDSASINPNKGEDFSQEILGRMLGLRAPSRMSSSTGSSVSQAGCGVLRTCCAIPPQMLASLAPDSNGQLQQLQQQMMLKQQQQQQPIIQQRFQMLPKTQQTAYGFPAGAMTATAGSAGSLMQLQQPAVSMNSNLNQQLQLASLNAPMQMLNNGQMQQENQQLANSLAHRSTQFQQSNQQFQQLPSQVRPQYQMQQMYPQQQQQQQQQQLVQQQQQNSLALLGSQVMASQPPAWQQQQQQMLAMNKPNNNNALMRQQMPLRSTLVGSSSSNNNNNRKILDGRCGLRQSAGINGRVQNLQYGENSADFGEYPAQAAILKKLSGSDSLFVCGGTLISQYWIATAAHCIKKHIQHQPNELKVRLGEWDVHRDDEFYPFVEKDIRDVVIHPEFVSGNLVNDIALLRLDSPIDPTLPHVNPACLPMLDENFSRQKCWVTGWGKDSFGQKGTFQSVLQEVELPVGEHAECEAALRQTRLGPHYRLHPGFICAGGEGGRDACEGDGGSGLYCIQDGIIKVAGLVSWGIGCGQAGVPGVYVNMAHYRGWIENIIAIDEDVYSPYANTLAGNSISERSNNNSSTNILPQDNDNHNQTIYIDSNTNGANPNQLTSTISPQTA